MTKNDPLQNQNSSKDSKRFKGRDSRQSRESRSREPSNRSELVSGEDRNLEFEAHGEDGEIEVEALNGSDSVTAIYLIARKFPPLPFDKQRRLLELAKLSPDSLESKRAAGLLTVHSYSLFIGLANSILQLWAPEQKQQFADLVHEGAKVLPIAIDGFDLAKNTSFPTFARTIVSLAMLHYLRDNVSAIKWSDHIERAAFVIHLSIKKLRSDLGREPSIDEIAEDSQISPKLVRQAINLSLTQRNLRSLDTPVPGGESEGGTDTLAEFVEDETASAESLALEHEREKLITETLRILRRLLTREERQVLELRYGFTIGEESEFKQFLQGVIQSRENEIHWSEQERLSVRQTALELRMSKSAVQRLERRAILKLRKHLAGWL